MSKKCDVCGNKIKFLENFDLKDGKICQNCGYNIGLDDSYTSSVHVANLLTVQDVINYQNSKTKINPKQYWADFKTNKKQTRADNKDQYNQLVAQFKEDKAWHIGKVYFNKKRQQILVKKTILDNLDDEPLQLYNYADLTSYEPIETPATIEKKHGLSRAIVGGIVAGPTGAALGAFSGNKSYDAVSRVSIMLYFTGECHTEAVLLKDTTKTDSSIYRSVQKSLSHVCHDLEEIIKENSVDTTNETTIASTDSADELRKLKSLLDDGILTEEEFTSKKKQILGI